MKTKFRIFGLFTLLTLMIPFTTFSQEWIWGNQFSGDGDIEPVDIKIDGSDNIYVVGISKGTTLTIGTATYSSKGDWDVFLASFTSGGGYRWSRQLAGAGRDDVGGMDIDASGNIYIVGSYRDNSIYFTATDFLENDDNFDSYLAVYNTSGTFIRARRLFWGTDTEKLLDVVVDDPNSRLAVVGNFKNEVIYNDGATEQTVTAVGPKDQLVATFNYSGDFLDIAVFDVSLQQTAIKNINICLFGGYYVGGDLREQINFGGGNSLIGDAVNMDAMIFRVNSSLDYVWGRLGKGTGYDHVNSSTVDEYGQAYITGKTESSTLTFDSTGTLSATPLSGFGSSDMYIAKYDQNGTLQWVRRKGNSGDDNAYGLAYFNDVVQFAGNFAGQIIFNQDTLDSGNLSNVNTGFAKFDLKGNEIGAAETSGSAEDRGTGVIFDSNGETIMTGFFASNPLTAGTITLTNTSGTTNGFLLKYEYPLSILLTGIQHLECFGDNDGAIDITVSGGVTPYSFNWTTSDGSGLVANDEDQTGLTAGTYAVEVTDDKGETAKSEFTITQPTAISISGTITDVACNGDNDGAIAITVTGGSSPYTFAWTTSDGSGLIPGDEDQTGLTAGTYVVTVTDAIGCTSVESYEVTEPDPLTGSIASQTNVACYGGADGSVTITGAGGTGPYQYSLDGGTYQGSGTFNGLAANSYTVTIRDAHSCTYDIEVIITQPASSLSGSITSQTNVACFGGATGSVTVNGIGGTSPYQYRLNSGTYQTSGTFIGLTAGTYTVTVRDANLCTFIVPVTITQPASSLTGSITAQTNVSCFGDITGSVTVAGSGGTMPYQYSLDGGPYQGSGTFSSLTPNTYIVTIRDANLCIFNVPVTITGPTSALSGNIIAQTDVACYGEATGSVIIAASGGTTPYEYRLNGGPYQSSGTFSGLVANTYTITIRDANLCTVQIVVNITQPDAPLSIYATALVDVRCFGGSSGSVTIRVVDGTGTPPYEYSIDNGATYQSSGIFTGLSAGIYTAIVRDANECTDDVAVEISQPATPLTAVILSQSDVLCFGEATGSATVEASGGIAPYEYNFNGGTYQSSGVFTGLIAGTHTIRVRDANSCTFDVPVIIAQPTADLVVSGVVTGVSIAGGNDGAIDITVTGGTAGYTYVWSTTGGSGLDINAEDQTGLTAGTYQVIVTDANLCTTTDTYIVTEPGVLTVGGVITNPTCFGSDDGAINITVGGGIPPFTYLWSTSNGSGLIPADEDQSNLSAGTYTVLVTDDNGATATDDFILTEPSIISINSLSSTNITCFGADDGTITISSVTGGNGGYQYSVDGGATYFFNGGSFSDLSPDTYDIVVRDSEGCTSDESSITLTEPTELIISSFDDTDVSCFGADDGTITIVAGGGTPPYEYSIDGCVTFFSNDGQFTGVSAGNYDLCVRDAHGCIVNGSTIIITQPASEITIGNVTSTNVTCFGGADGTITISSVSGGNGGFVYSIDGGSSYVANGGIFTGLVAGTYDIRVRDSQGCSKDGGTIIIAEPQELTIVDMTYKNIGCFGANDGSITIVVSGGTPPYRYSIDNCVTYFSNNGFFTGLASGTYNVCIRDANGCIISGGIITLTEPTLPLEITIDEITDALCAGVDNGSITVSASGGTAPYAYSIDGGVSFLNNGGLFNNVGAGTYPTSVRDAGGCIVSGLSASVSEPDPIAITSESSTPTCYGLIEGVVSVTAEGGTGTLTYTLNPGGIQNNTGVFSGLAINIYTVAVTDENDCGPVMSNPIEVGQATDCKLEVFNAFSPNGDGINDYWNIQGISPYPDCLVKVFNSWGSTVFVSDRGYPEPWNGYLNNSGKLLPAGTYYYVIDLGDGVTLTGTVNIIK